MVTDGWMQPLIRKIGKSDGYDFVVKRRSELTILPRDKNKHAPWPGGHGDKALIAKKIAEAGNYDALIFMVDADSVKSSRLKEIENEIIDGFSRIEGNVKCITCIPMSASESWLLSDRNAWQQISGDFKEVLPKKPEEIWGKRSDPNGDHPHQVFRRICAKSDIADCTKTRAEIASGLDLEILASACPISLKPFIASIVENCTLK